MGEPTRDDIADLFRLNEALDQALTKSIAYYSEALEGSHNLVLGVLSHDLLGPLTSAQMSADLIPELGELNERQTMLIAQIIDSTDRATSIIHSLIDLTKAKVGSGQLIIKSHMDTAFVGRQLVDEMRIIYPDRTFKLEISGDTQGEWDQPRVGQVLSNLLGNAVRYGFSETPVVVTIVGLPEEVTVSVHNDGVPIPPALMAKLFNAFTRGDVEESIKAKGSTNLGLGLYIVKEIVSAHGGTIDVTSTEIEGTTFTAHFPRSPSEQVPSPGPSRFSGKKLFPTETAKKTNPRREKSHGHRSLEVIRSKPGITYEQFLRAGGRRVDLAWDVQHGNAEAKS